MSTHSEFKIAYDGEALASHAMDVKELAPALLAFGSLCDEANRVLNGNKAIVRLEVKATTIGSFDIVFNLHQSLGAQLTQFLTGDHITAADNLATFIGFIGVLYNGTKYSLFSLIRKLRGKKPNKVTDLKNGQVTIELDNETFTVPIELMRLYQDIGVRTAVQQILMPLKKEGVDTFKVLGKNQEPIEIIQKEEINFYDVPEIQDEMILESIKDSAYSIVSLAFKEDNKWRLYNGEATINAKILDEVFLKEVENNTISFSKGDILVCTVRTIQYKTSIGNLKIEHEVLKVNEHRPAAKQMLLFDVDNYPSSS